MLVLPVEILYGFSSITQVELFNGLECNLNLVYLFISVVLEHEITASINLLFVFLNSLVHLFLEPHLDGESQFRAKAILDIYQYDKEECSTAF